MSGDNNWVQVADVDDVRSRPFKTVFPKGIPVIVIVKGDDLFALSNRCPHLGCTLSTGILTGETIVCPCHDWSFDIRTGELLMSREIKLQKYDTKVEDGKLLIKMED